MENKERNYERYLKQGSNYEPIGETKDILPSGFYRPVYDSYHNRVYLTSKEVIMPKLYVLPNDIQNAILDDIQMFWQSEERYRKFGNVYKRNILLYSLPGNGKTSLINIIANKLITDYNGIVIFIDSVEDLSSYRTVMERFRSVEPNRKVVTIIEDFERLAKDDRLTAMLLQTLDGNGQFDNVVTIATTNYPEILEKRFTCRPSRFNMVIEYKKPNAEIRKSYIEMKLSDSGIDINEESVKADIERYVSKTEGYTFDFLKEVIQGIYVDGISEVGVFDRLEDLIKKDGKIRVSEDEAKRIGFSTEDSDNDAVGG
jgi:SpoVK/Ycf46/Vps4 family AAA+-type ATPase